MAITIIHGANGGYKSSSVVQERIIPAMLEGRTVVTNIRGVDLQKFYDSGFDVHKDSKIIYVDTDNNKEGKLGRLLMACFWHWVPSDCLICFDESGVIFPKSWRDKDIKDLDHKFNECLTHSIFNDYEIEQIERPDSFVEAFEMHRHYGWDLVLSAPNIKSIRDEIRNTTELAWRHRNAALIGLKGRFKAVSHDPTNLGTSATQALDTRIGKIKKETFDCYDSTKTGNAVDTANGAKSIFTPRLLLALACSAAGFIYAFSSGGFDTLGGPPVSSVSSSGLEIPNQTVSSSSVVSVPVSQADSSVVSIMGYDMASLRIVGRFGSYYLFKAVDLNGVSYDIDKDHLIDSGYMMIPKSDCHMLIVSVDFSKSIYCELSPSITKKENDRLVSDMDSSREPAFSSG